MICPNCGSENKDDATFCQFCGQRFGPKTDQTADAENSKTEDTMYGEWNHSDNNWNGQPNWNPNDGWNQNQQGWSGNSYQSNGYPNNGYPNNGYPNNSYQSNGYQQPWNNGSQRYNGFAIAALIIGILSILPCCLFPYIGIPMNIVGLVLGIIGYRKPYGRGMSIAAIVVNIIFLALAIVWLVICLYIYANIDMNAYYQMFEDYMY